ncbi:hypothetical protein [Psychrobacter sp. I-STPA10]|uniref:hypothetical protein n=1 Tax=Psychrobacter sp. I-STPA10 TaxID=2585769 RepID=UPI001E39740E|nr:hypothetical protein [Psychrobacter sp. I-STPA10]
MKMTLKLASLTSTLLLTGLLAGCGGDSGSDNKSDDKKTSSQTENTTKPKSTVPKDIQGYYEAIVTADNGDRILLNLTVKPDGEYFGFYNNSFIDGNYKYKQEIFSLITGDFNQDSAKKITTRVREFDSAQNIVRNYNASAQFVPKSRLTLDLTNSDASIDKKVYDLKYIKLDSSTLSELTGNYRGTIGSLTKYKFANAIISDSDNADIKNLKIKVGSNCEFNGTVENAHYDVNLYPYSGSFSGTKCTTLGKFTGVMYKVNKRILINGINTNKTDIMRFSALQ